MRRRKAKKRIILPDPRFNDITVTKFVNNLMLDGKKSLSFNIFYDAIDTVNSFEYPQNTRNVSIINGSGSLIPFNDVNGNPVMLVATPLAGVPKAGATKTIPEAIVP